MYFFVCYWIIGLIMCHWFEILYEKAHVSLYIEEKIKLLYYLGKEEEPLLYKAPRDGAEDKGAH